MFFNKNKKLDAEATAQASPSEAVDTADKACAVDTEIADGSIESGAARLMELADSISSLAEANESFDISEVLGDDVTLEENAAPTEADADVPAEVILPAEDEAVDADDADKADESDDSASEADVDADEPAEDADESAEDEPEATEEDAAESDGDSKAEEKAKGAPKLPSLIAAIKAALAKKPAKDAEDSGHDSEKPEDTPSEESVSESEVSCAYEAAADADAAEDVSAEALNDFEASIRDFSEDDVDALVESRAKGFDAVRIAVLVICVTVCVISTSSLIRNIYDKFRGEQIYGDIINSVADGFNMDGNVENEGGKIDLLGGDNAVPYTPTMGDIVKNGITEVSTPTDHSAELARMRASLESLRNINDEIYGWIKIPNTNINYPIAQTDNNEYYLDHAYTGEDLVNGSIYADFRCNPVLTDNYNTILYGHNITTGSMFNHVTKFFDEEFFNETLIYIYTFDGIYIYKPFSIHEAAYDSGYVDVGFLPEEFVKFALNLASLSDIPSDVSFVPEDSILTLSTCTNGLATKRYALHAKMIEVITDKQ